MKYTFERNLDNTTLRHFGILGMKWGKRNGPPYPLGSDISTGKRLKDTGKKKENSKPNNTVKSTGNKKEVSDNNGFKSDGDGYFSKQVKVSDSSGKDVSLHFLYDSKDYQGNERSPEEITKKINGAKEAEKNFKEIDRAVRDVIEKDFSERAAAWGVVDMKSFKKSLKEPLIYIVDDDFIEVSYYSPHTYHEHSVEYSLKNKKADRYASMNG